MLENLLRSAEATYGVPAAPTAAREPMFAAVDISSLPVGMQNNNPGNIKFVAGNYWQGQIGPSYNTDQGDPQVVFDNAADGMLAAAQLVLLRYGWGHNTVRKLIADPRVGWTPGYVAGARGVAAGSGLGLDQKLDPRNPVVLAKLLRGIVTQEHGPAGSLYPDDLIKNAAAKALG